MVSESYSSTDYPSTTKDDTPISIHVNFTSTSNTSSIETSSTPSNGTLTTHDSSPDTGMDTGGSVGVAIVVALLFVGGILLFLYLRRTGKLKCLATRGRPRRSSTSSSRRALAPDNESVDNMPRITDSDMFAINEPEGQDQEHEVAGDDGYYYDEVFGSSGFEDETTKASNKELFSVSSDQDVPDLLLRVDELGFK